MVSTRFLSKRGIAATVALAAVALLGLTTLPGNDAEAAPTLADAERTLSSLGSQLDKVNEQYNEAAALLAASKVKQADLLKQIKPYQERADVYSKRVDTIAAAAYRGGRPSVLNAIVKGDSPQTVVDQLGALDQVTRDQEGVLDALKKAKEPIKALETKIDAEIAEQAKQTKALADRKAVLNKDLAKWTQLRAQLKPRASRSSSRGSTGPVPPFDQSLGGQAAAYARRQAGDPYVFGADGPTSFDCSGLTLAAWAAVGVSMPHSAHQQYNMFPKVPRGQWKPGDLIGIYSDIHHIGIYLGGNMMMHAPEPGEDVVQVDITTSYWRGVIQGAARPHK